MQVYWRQSLCSTGFGVLCKFFTASKTKYLHGLDRKPCNRRRHGKDRCQQSYQTKEVTWTGFEVFNLYASAAMQGPNVCPSHSRVTVPKTISVHTPEMIDWTTLAARAPSRVARMPPSTPKPHLHELKKSHCSQTDRDDLVRLHTDSEAMRIIGMDAFLIAFDGICCG